MLECGDGKKDDAVAARIKELNPGFDLLLSADWTSRCDKPRQPASRNWSPFRPVRRLIRPPTADKPDESLLEFHYVAFDSRWIFAAVAPSAVVVFVVVRRFV
jgi:hypothetical protein